MFAAIVRDGVRCVKENKKEMVIRAYCRRERRKKFEMTLSRNRERRGGIVSILIIFRGNFVFNEK